MYVYPFQFLNKRMTVGRQNKTLYRVRDKGRDCRISESVDSGYALIFQFTLTELAPLPQVPLLSLAGCCGFVEPVSPPLWMKRMLSMRL
jgi:hypothetical protein